MGLWPSACPAQPSANRIAHYELLIGLRDPVYFLEMRHALAPGARHLRDIGPPEQSPRAKRVIHGAIVLMQAFEGIRIIGIERSARKLHRHVGIARKRQ